MNLLKRRPRENPRINLVPLIDTLFLLLVFFMMTTSFNQQSQLSINLPEASGKITTETQKPIRILIDAKGNYAINDFQHSLVNTQRETLKHSLQEAVGTQTKPTFLISADANAPHESVMKAMDILSNLGYTRLGFEAQRSPEKK